MITNGMSMAVFWQNWLRIIDAGRLTPLLDEQVFGFAEVAYAFARLPSGRRAKASLRSRPLLAAVQACFQGFGR